MTIRPFAFLFTTRGFLSSPLFALSGNLDSNTTSTTHGKTKQPSASVSIARSQTIARALDSLSPHKLILLISKLSRQKLCEIKAKVSEKVFVISVTSKLPQVSPQPYAQKNTHLQYYQNPSAHCFLISQT